MRLSTAFACTAATADSFEFKQLGESLNEEWITQALEATGTASIRRRRLPAEQVVWIVIGMALMRDLPITKVVAQLDLALPGARTRRVAASAIPSARRRLGAEAVEWLFVRSADQWAHESAAKSRWRKLALYGIDGTTLRVPDSGANRSTFGGQSAGGNGRGESGYPMVRMAALMAVRSHLLAGACFGPYAVDERRYAEELWAMIPDHSLTLLDRNFLQANVLLSLSTTGTERHWLTRAKSNSAWTVIEKLGKGDFLVEVKVTAAARKQNAALPKSFRCRVVEYQHRGHPAQRLVTSLVDAKKYPSNELIALYHERWEIELGYDEIKTKVLQRQECIRSQSPAGVRQEIWGILLAYNLVRLEMERVAETLKISPLRISFITSLRTIRDLWSLAAMVASTGNIARILLDFRIEARSFVLPPRRRRRFPRHVKIKMSSYPRNRPSASRLK